MAGVAAPIDRFQSFAERYVIERASHYRGGNEQQDAWQALQDAKKIYDMIGEATRLRNAAETPDQQAPVQNGGAGQPAQQIVGQQTGQAGLLLPWNYAHDSALRGPPLAELHKLVEMAADAEAKGV